MTSMTMVLLGIKHKYKRKARVRRVDVGTTGKSAWSVVGSYTMEGS